MLSCPYDDSSLAFQDQIEDEKTDITAIINATKSEDCLPEIIILHYCPVSLDKEYNRRLRLHDFEQHKNAFQNVVALNDRKEEKIIQINSIETRIYTFTCKNWENKCKEWWPKDLAETGFYYRGNALEIHCVYCNLKTDVSEWSLSPKENPSQAHARLNKDCSYVKEHFYKPRQDIPKKMVTLKTNTTDSMRIALANSPLPKDCNFDLNHNEVSSQNLSGDRNTSSDTNLTIKPQMELQKSITVINNEGKQISSAIEQHSCSLGTPNSDHKDSHSEVYFSTKDRNNDQSSLELKNHFDTVSTPAPEVQTHIEKTSLNTNYDNNMTFPGSHTIETDCLTSRVSNFASSLSNEMKSQLSFDGTSLPDFKYPKYQERLERIKTFTNWRFEQKQPFTGLVEAGYFYTGESDIVRCFCCDLGLAEWDSKDDPWVEHARHNPKCWYLKHKKGEAYIDRIQFRWREIYNPKHAAFEDKVSRIASFDGWRTDIEQTPEILADAGFFYTGEEDVVRCHYCDGGLRHWEQGDVPWEEHGKWFPFCKFVIKMKGREFIEEMKRKREAMERGQQEDTTPVSENTDSPPILKTLQTLGFNDADIRNALTEYERLKGHTSYTAEEIIDLIVDGNNTTEARKQTSAVPATICEDKQSKEEDPQTIMEINRQLKQKVKCIRCKTEDICMLFVNCGHRITCEGCAYRMDFCPMCDKRIKKRMKTFLS